ncbi:2,4-dienoyl-CoA reductase-like NADH-dependent reductase (Old Yellow Enzyme family) [Winogradskyella epiphytica]|uniref:2,4-dienoyl-CoA reductase-like NADH-dependent reductase (Old Yellow Enzyme family) n=1 Tax=Winogradskyella epiphytica TaxID=262005 RepID=A0A2V4WUS3_9FLAO|nr:NADH:flavin oxidoreductase [Winogradskyella epiphytica]PYE80207.1 2,4-dienoyl-CoA reductase-like NADH-dependent reductase (Old Yellow Enzyme family) [Winogradskyella epiphytica]
MNELLNSPLQFPCGAQMKNRFMLAPLTNTQSHSDGRLSEDEFRWLQMRAEGQFGLVMTCASHVQKVGQGFPGQLGIYSDAHIKGHTRLASAIKSYGSLAVIQLHHAGMRSPEAVINSTPVCPSANEKQGARALNLAEIEELKADFIQAALRAQKSGYDGVEVHGAHGYILTQFLSSEINKRTDAYGGSLENRSRLLFEIVHGIRAACGTDFLLGVRLSPERFGMRLEEVKQVCQRFIDEEVIDFLDISLWDVFKAPEEEAFKGTTLLSHFTALDFKSIRLTVAGKISTGEDVSKVLASGVDFVSIGRSAILHHDFPVKVMADPEFEPIATPVTPDYLKSEGIGEDFINYLKRWPDLVGEE